MGTDAIYQEPLCRSEVPFFRPGTPKKSTRKTTDGMRLVLRVLFLIVI